MLRPIPVDCLCSEAVSEGEIGVHKSEGKKPATVVEVLDETAKKTRRCRVVYTKGAAGKGAAKKASPSRPRRQAACHRGDTADKNSEAIEPRRSPRHCSKPENKGAKDVSPQIQALEKSKDVDQEQNSKETGHAVEEGQSPMLCDTNFAQ